MTLQTAQIAKPGAKFGFQIRSDGLKHCWVDSNPGLRQLIAAWVDSSGRSEIAKTRISLPLYATAEDPLSVLNFVSSPKVAGSYSFQIREIDHRAVNLPPQKVVLAEPPEANSVTAPRQLSAVYQLTSSPTELVAGGKGRIELSARNTGTAAWLSIWPPAKGSTGLGYRWIDSSGKEVSAGRLYLPYAVYPGVTYNYSGPIDAPAEPGEYTLYLGMVSELMVWFHDVGVAPIETHVVVRPSGDK